MQALGGALKAQIERMSGQFCPKCGFYVCQCAALAAQKAKEEQAEKIRLEHQKQAEIKRLGGVRAYEDFTAATYTNKALLAALKNYPQENYYLWGVAGSGKTHAAVASLRHIPAAVVVRMAQISREVRACQTPQEEERIIARYCRIPLCLDDLGSEKATEFLQNTLFEIMDRRWQNKQGGLIITANMSIEKLGAIVGDRTASRIAGLVGSKNTLELTGQDWRLKNA